MPVEVETHVSGTVEFATGAIATVLGLRSPAEPPGSS